MATPRITIGIPTYNGGLRLGWLLSSIEMRTPEIKTGEARVVVVDDGSPHGDVIDTVIEGQRRLNPHMSITHIKHERNRGISAGWNTASRVFESEIVALINDDVIVPSCVGGWLKPLTHVLDRSPGVGAVGTNWHAFLPDKDVSDLLRAETSDRDVVPRDCVSKQHAHDRRGLESCNPGRVMAPGGQLFAFRRSDFDAIDGFDEGYQSFYEETDFGTAMASKLRKIGVQLNHPMCWHMWSATFAQNPELNAGGRMAASRARYREKWGVPSHIQHECPEWTNPRNLGTIGDVDLEWVRFDGSVECGTLRQDCAYVKRAA